MYKSWWSIRARLSVLVSLLLGLVGCSEEALLPYSETKSEHNIVTKKELLQVVREQMQQHHIVGLSIAVLKEQQVVFAGGFGYANREANIRASEKTLYRAGSISKLFTSAAIMQLAEAGKIRIDAPLSNALSDFSIRTYQPGQAEITPRMVMTHHAGLPGDVAEGMWTEHPAHFSKVLEYLRDTYTSYQPDYIHAYSNAGFDLLGLAIERVSGQSFESYMHEHLLFPMGMRDSAFDTQLPLGPNTAQAYDEHGDSAEELALRDIPAGGLNTSVMDLLQFAKMVIGEGQLDNNTILNAASVSAMQSPQNLNSPLDIGLQVGLGWHFLPEPVHGSARVLFHDGATMNHRAMLLVAPQQKIAVAIMSNSADALEGEDEIARQVLVMYRNEKFGTTGSVERNNSVERNVGQNPLYPPASIAAYPGFYATPMGFVEIRQEKDALSVLLNGDTLAFKQQADGYMKLEYRLLGLMSLDLGKLGKTRFTLAHIDGQDVLLTSDSQTFFLAGQKILPKPISEKWRARLGDYRYASNDAYLRSQLEGVTLLIQNGYLLAEIHGKQGSQQISLDAVMENQAVIRGLGRGMGETVFAEKSGQDDLLKYSGMTFIRNTSTVNRGS